MKTISIPDEMHDALMQLAKEYTTQNDCGQAMPLYFTIKTMEREHASEGCGEYFEWSDGCNLTNGTTEDLIKWAEGYFDGALPEDWKDLDEDEKIDWLKDNGCYLDEYNEVPRFQNAFFTSKACKAHIESNHYHYNEPRSYADTFCHNPEMNLIANLLIHLSKDKQ